MRALDYVIVSIASLALAYAVANIAGNAIATSLNQSAAMIEHSRAN